MNVDIDKPIQVNTVDFLKAFGYTDKDKVYFRLFHDKDNTQKAYNFEFGLSKIGADAGDTLKNYNSKGYGIFFVVNGDGQADKDVKHARAQYIEIDDKPFNEQLEIIGDFPLEPSIIVKTRKSLHTYWLLKDGDIKRFRDIQERLISYFNSDQTIKNESRVMRLPNFTHNKQEPIEVQVIKFNPELIYTQDEIAGLLPEVRIKTAKQTERRQTPTNGSVEDIRAALGGRHRAIMSIGGTVRQAVKDLPPEVLTETMISVNNMFSEPLEDAELNKCIKDLQNYNAEDADTEQRIQENYIDVFTETTKPEETLEDYLAESAADLADLDALIEYTGNTPAISTGFSKLDAFIDDGIRNGFYVLGAISSLGKSTFCIQIADIIAKQGQDVLYYSLEMSKAEIQAKSLSRESLIASLELTHDSKTAKSTTNIMNGRHALKYTDDERRTINKAKTAYTEYAGHIHIITGRKTARDIELEALKHKQLTGNMPVIFVDYLQLLQSPATNKNLTDKQITDANVDALKNLSHNMPIVAISSFNRESYTEPVTLSAFKESGIIEYTSDILIGLQYEGMDYRTIEKEKDGKITRRRETQAEHAARVAELLEEQEEIANNGSAQKIQVKILKNRYGKRSRKGFTVKYFPIFNYFENDILNPFISDEENEKPQLEQITYKRKR